MPKASKKKRDMEERVRKLNDSRERKKTERQKEKDVIRQAQSIISTLACVPPASSSSDTPPASKSTRPTAISTSIITNEKAEHVLLKVGDLKNILNHLSCNICAAPVIAKVSNLGLDSTVVVTCDCDDIYTRVPAAQPGKPNSQRSISAWYTTHSSQTKDMPGSSTVWVCCKCPQSRARLIRIMWITYSTQ